MFSLDLTVKFLDLIFYLKKCQSFGYSLSCWNYILVVLNASKTSALYQITIQETHRACFSNRDQDDDRDSIYRVPNMCCPEHRAHDSL